MLFCFTLYTLTLQEATWYEWVYNARGILYLDEDGGNGTREKVYVVVNPVLAPLAFAAVLACVLWLAVSCGPLGYLRGGVQTQSGKASRRKSSIRKGAARTDASGDEGELDDLGLAPKDWSAKMREPSVVAFFVAGYALNLLPYAAVKRCTFVYHYLYVLFVPPRFVLIFCYYAGLLRAVPCESVERGIN
jgi:C-terminal four TMM region of protein-O-mannosyltransferase